MTSETNLGCAFAQAGAGIHLSDAQPDTVSRAFHEVDKLQKTGLLKPMGIRAKKLIEQVYNWETITDAVIDMYNGK